RPRAIASAGSVPARAEFRNRRGRRRPAAHGSRDRARGGLDRDPAPPSAIALRATSSAIAGAKERSPWEPAAGAPRPEFAAKCPKGHWFRESVLRTHIFFDRILFTRIHSRVLGRRDRVS